MVLGEHIGLKVWPLEFLHQGGGIVICLVIRAHKYRAADDFEELFHLYKLILQRLGCLLSVGLVKVRSKLGAAEGVPCHIKSEGNIFQLHLLINCQKGAQHGEHGIGVFSIGGV